MVRLVVALIQLDVLLGDKKANLEKAIQYITEAANKGADVVCLPEYFSTGIGYKDPVKMQREIIRLAEPIRGPTIQELCQTCKNARVSLVGGFVEIDQDKKLYNTAFFINASGEIVGIHRKVHLFQIESQVFQKGNEWRVFDTDFGKVGMMICYDAIFPEAARTLALAGAKIIFHPSSWMDPFVSQWRVATSARALDNQIWMVSVNRVGKDELFTYFGRSRVVDPYGVCVLECGEGEELAIAEIDLEKVEEFRSFVNFLRDRQPATYKLQ